MATEQRKFPADPIAFIRTCIAEGKVFWTYHANMRLQRRALTRAEIFSAAPSFALVEAYPDDKYLPSYLVLGHGPIGPLHVLIAADVEGDNIRIVTAYRPDPDEWEDDLKARRNP